MSLQGQQLGRYRIVSLLGSGGMGDVYLAEDARIEQQVALKVVKVEINPSASSQMQEDAARLFQREARAVARLDHPHILPLFDYGEHPYGSTTLLYLVMPYRREGSLVDWLHRQGQAGPLATWLVAHWLRQAAEALQHAHDHQIVHQDVKLSNFLIRERKEAPPDLLLSDFGIARLSSATESASQAIRGTPVSMAPEQWQGQAVPATDQYALAVMAYQLLVGRAPFVGALGPLMFQHLSSPPPALSSLDPRFSAEVDSVLLHALAKQPEGRFRTIAAFAQALQQALAALPPVAATPSPLATPLRPAGEIQVTLAISPTEAQAGAVRTLTLPDGRHLRVSIPAGVQDGQTVRLQGQAQESGPGMAGETLLVHIRVHASEQAAPYDPNSALPTEKVAPPLPPNVLAANAITTPAQDGGSLGLVPSEPRAEAGELAALVLSAGSGDERSTELATDFLSPTVVQPGQGNLAAPEAKGASLKPAQVSGSVPVSPSAMVASPSLPIPGWRKRLRSPIGRAVQIALVVLLLAAGAVGVSSAVTGHLPWSQSSGWQIQHANTSNSLIDVAWSGSQFVAVGDKGTILTSPDGNTWAPHALPAPASSQYISGVAWSNAQFVAVGDKGTILTSPDGKAWTQEPLPASASSTSLIDAVWSNAQFVVVGEKGTILTSPDGKAWTLSQPLPALVSSRTLFGVAWSGSHFVAVGGDILADSYNSIVLTSLDGKAWTLSPPRQQVLASPRTLLDVACSKEQCLAVGIEGFVLTSSDENTWMIPPALPTSDASWYGVAWSGSHFVAVGSKGTILVSP